MGARLVSMVLTRWTHVSDRAFRVLVRMALTALDESNNGTPAGLYFGGRDLLALTLRAERGGDQEAVYRTVRKAVAELVKEGAIERTNLARAGINAVYRLTLNAAQSIDRPAVDTAVDSPGQGDPSGPPEADSSGPPQGDPSGSSRGTPADPPRNHDEPVEELCEEREQLGVPTAVTGPRAHEAAEDPISLPSEPEPTLPALRLIEGNPGRPVPAVDEPRPLWPASVPALDPPAVGELRGHGFCLPCHATGRITVAADPVHGAACAFHLRSAS